MLAVGAGYYLFRSGGIANVRKIFQPVQPDWFTPDMKKPLRSMLGVGLLLVSISIGLTALFPTRPELSAPDDYAL
ncbi:MAG TPA: hypothetical protein VHO48_14515, partial [Anaerolineaceae bacterium]|nr:hypothetical protein [Anaerolineaceae bacterium]